jgi:hypothetical protein
MLIGIPAMRNKKNKVLKRFLTITLSDTISLMVLFLVYSMYICVTCIRCITEVAVSFG